MLGIIIKATAGYYYVRCGPELVSCRARGKFRLEEEHPLVGDHVEFSLCEDGSGYLLNILPRRNSFVRPAIANIDMLVMVASAADPVTDPYLIDRVSSFAENYGCDFLLVLNKFDLNPAKKLCSIYEKTPYTVLCTSVKSGVSLDRLTQELQGKICVFTGNSGVGKSSLVNALHPPLQLTTGGISEKIGRGRHTTRHVELFSLPGGGFIADTPGFGSFDVDQMEPLPTERLAFCFPEFRPYLDGCRFNNCRHDKEPGCALRSAVVAEAVSKSRYDSYLRLLAEAKSRREY